MVRRYVMVVMILSFVLGGCAKSGSDDVQERLDGARDSVKTGADHVWSAQVQALDKAKDVGRNLMDEAQKQRQAIDQQSE